jgi:hypothetical protein
MDQRNKPYFWVTWLAALMSGSDNCEWKFWLKGHYTKVPKIERDFDNATFNENHTAMLNETRDQFLARGSEVIVEKRWKIEGKSAIVAGSIDLITLNPNLIIDTKTGRQKTSHAAQVKIYLLAAELGAIPGVSGDFKGLVKYSSDEFLVEGVDGAFKERFFALVRNLASDKERTKVPSKWECEFCDIKNCDSRFVEEEEKVFETAEF